MIRYAVAYKRSGHEFAWFTGRSDAYDFIQRIKALEPGIEFTVIDYTGGTE